MHLSIALLLAALSLPVLATDAPKTVDGAKPPVSQQKMKERLLRHVEARIKILQDSHACIKAAADMQAIGDCHEQERKSTKALRERARAEMLAPR
ncbi:MAG: hypothetical protein JNL78_10720 [Rhodocyclaceae bacterium]|jgi:hypothetical protein|nr:hypothetical protein [Rhodocyclaceae bacterium]